ncbi:MAG: type I pullulanase [Bacilli bacterium]|nr:type I pullulanase [Bacilli bacterium]
MKNIKRILPLTLMCLMSIGMVGCNNKKQNTEPDTPVEPDTPTPPTPQTPIENDSGLPTTIVPLEEPGIQIHYQRISGSYKIWGLWLWAEGKDGAEYPFNYADDYGVIAYYPLSTFGNPRSLGFIVKELFSSAGDGVWNKDGNYDRFMDLDMLEKDENDVYHVWIRSKLVDVYTDPNRENVMNAVTTCQFDDSKNITVVVNNAIKDPVLYCNDQVYSDATLSGSKLTKKFTLPEAADVADSYYVHIEFEKGGQVDKNVSIRKLYDYNFEMKYNYTGDLGAIYSQDSTTFKVWSPISQAIKLRLYNNGTPLSIDEDLGDDSYSEFDMVKDSKGVFSYTALGDMAGKYYTYVVYNSYNPDGREIVDPYAKSAGVNGVRGMIVNFDETDPSGWDEVEYKDTDRKALTVYESHVADLTSSETWTGTEANRKKFAGMHESGTTYTEGDVTVKTGFDHVKELGVNAIQVIPFFDQANDEVNVSFNWGYNPLNYNVVEGAYSSDPYDGYVRIRELKETIQAYKEAGMSFIMDVVYNHVNGLAGSNFDVLMPFYYFRYTETGGASSGSGCGNDTASEHLMFRKFMIDSAKFWTEEYKMDGFRFDLMGLHDLNTMNKLVEEVQEINPYSVIYGEPWMLGTAVAEGTVMANQNNASLYEGFGQFNDKFRDALISGGLSPKESKGWIFNTSNPVAVKTLYEGMMGNTSYCTEDPDKTVTYVTCHDNYTLHDRGVAAGIYDEESLKKSNALGASFIFMSQGTSFMLSGDEILRSKVVYDTDGNPIPILDTDGNPTGFYEVSENSYNSCYKTNEIDYSLKVENEDLFSYWQKLIALKQNVADLQLDLEGVKSTTTYTVSGLRTDSIVKVTFSDDDYDYEAYIASPCLYNYSKDEEGDTPYEIDLAGQEIYLDTLAQNVTGTSIEIQPYETIVLRTAK